MERMMGIEPTCFAWEANILPLNYIRIFFNTISFTQKCHVEACVILPGPEGNRTPVRN